jgi:hypothetical protein
MARKVASLLLPASPPLVEKEWVLGLPADGYLDIT